MRIVFATGNMGKLREIREIMEDLDLPVVCLRDIGFDREIDENGRSFRENAAIKAQAAYAFLKEKGDRESIVLAEDSGLMIDALNGEPGIYSARYMGDRTAEETMKELLDRMKNVPDDERSARFCASVAAVFPDGSVRYADGIVEGVIAHEIRGTGGFGYDPIFLIPERGITTAEMTEEEKNALSHRFRALSGIKPYLRNYLGMKKFLIVSDTHGKEENLFKVLDRERDADVLLHLGDVEGQEDRIRRELSRLMPQAAYVQMRGNCDFDPGLPETKVLEYPHLSIFLTHGHRFMRGNSFEQAMELLAANAFENGCGYALFGHSHKPFEEKAANGVTLLNPGSLSEPRTEDMRPSYAVLTLDPDGVTETEFRFLSPIR